MNDQFIDMVAKHYEEIGDYSTAKVIRCAYHLGYADAGGKFKVVSGENKIVSEEEGLLNEQNNERLSL